MEYNKPFDRSKAGFDRYDRFYEKAGYNGVWTRFETGELVLTSYRIDHHARRRYPEFNVFLWGTADPWNWGNEKPRFKTPEGEDIRHSWLDVNGMQVFLLDPDTERALAVDRRQLGETMRNANVPSVFLADTIYFPGEKRVPVGEGPQIRRPNVLTTEQKQHMNELLLMCKAWVAMTVHDPRMKVSGTTPLEYKPGMDFNDIGDAVKYRIGKYGLTAGMRQYTVPYLVWTNPVQKEQKR
jgi:hypothetical protein